MKNIYIKTLKKYFLCIFIPKYCIQFYINTKYPAQGEIYKMFTYS